MSHDRGVGSYAPLTSLVDGSALHPNVRVEQLDWDDAFSQADIYLRFKSKLVEINADLVLGADIVFDPQLIPSLVATLVSTLEIPSSETREREALVALTLRNPTTLGLFLSTAGQCLLLDILNLDLIVLL